MSERRVDWAMRIERVLAALRGQSDPNADFWFGQFNSIRAERDDLTREITSLRASLDDANATISRLSGEKHARDVALRRVIEAAESVHEGERG